MTALEKIKEKHQEELAKAEREDAIARLCPVKPSQICVHRDSISLMFHKSNRDHYTLAEAVEIYRAFQPLIVEAEHWKAGCLSCRPEAINEYAKDESAVMDGAHHAEILLNSYGSRGEYQDMELRFWCKLGEDYCEVAIRFADKWEWLPDRRMSFSHYGDISNFQLTPKFIGEDKRTKWGHEPPCYRLSYYWADKHNFWAFLSNYLPEEARTA